LQRRGLTSKILMSSGSPARRAATPRIRHAHFIDRSEPESQRRIYACLY
jgi:hypothetical protein